MMYKKKCSRDDPSMYRVLDLLNHSYKIPSVCLLHRLVTRDHRLIYFGSTSRLSKHGYYFNMISNNLLEIRNTKICSFIYTIMISFKIHGVQHEKTLKTISIVSSLLKWVRILSQSWLHHVRSVNTFQPNLYRFLQQYEWKWCDYKVIHVCKMLMCLMRKIVDHCCIINPRFVRMPTMHKIPRKDFACVVGDSSLRWLITWLPFWPPDYQVVKIHLTFYTTQVKKKTQQLKGDVYLLAISPVRAAKANNSTITK